MLKCLIFAFITLTSFGYAHGWHSHYDIAEDEVNPTDSLAISSDSSEVEIDEELKELEELEKK